MANGGTYDRGRASLWKIRGSFIVRKLGRIIALLLLLIRGIKPIWSNDKMAEDGPSQSNSWQARKMIELLPHLGGLYAQSTMKPQDFDRQRNTQGCAGVWRSKTVTANDRQRSPLTRATV